MRFSPKINFFVVVENSRKFFVLTGLVLTGHRNSIAGILVRFSPKINFLLVLKTKCVCVCVCYANEQITAAATTNGEVAGAISIIGTKVLS